MPFHRTATAAALLLAFATHASAQTVTIEVTAQVDEMYDPTGALGNTILPGTLITGTYTYDSASSDTEPSSDFGHYHQPMGSYGFDLSAGGYRFSYAPDSDMFVEISSSATANGYHAANTNLAPLTNGANVEAISLYLQDMDGVNLLSDQLPTVAPSLDGFEERRLEISGSDINGLNQYDIKATVVSLATQQASVGDGHYTLQAQVISVDDYSGLLSGQIQVGMQAEGSFSFDPNTMDQDPNSNWGHYPQPNVAGLGFDLTLGGLTFRSNSTQGGLDANVINDTGWDAFNLASFSNEALANGTSVDHIDLDLSDPSGNAIASDALDPALPMNGALSERIMHIGGYNNGNWFSIELLVTGIAPAGGTAELELFPASGTVHPMQMFDFGVIFPPQAVPEQVSVQVNGAAIEGNCLEGDPNQEQRVSLICPGLSYTLQEGSNQVSVSAIVNGQTVTESVGYQVLSHD